MSDERLLATLPWQYPDPFLWQTEVGPEDIDIMGHTNNTVYVKWCENVAWAHSNALGLDWDSYQRLGRVMVARHHELDYLGASFAGEPIVAGTWIVANDGRLSLTRRYQIIRPTDQTTLLTGSTKFVCVDIHSGKPKRMPQAFVEGYAITLP